MNLIQVDAVKMLATSKKKRVSVNGQTALPLRTGVTLRHDPTTGDHVVRLHNTDIVRILSAKEGELQRYQIFAGDWRTNTTRDRINEYTGSRIYGWHGYWLIGSGHIFREGMTLDPFGDPEPAFQTPADKGRAFMSKARVLDKAIATYCKGFVQSAVSAKELNYPDGGDCWACFMRPADKVEARGFELMGTSHLIEHMIERYYVPSLLRNALNERFNWDSWQMGSSKDTPEEKLKKQETRMRGDYHHMVMEVQRGREPYMLYKVLRSYFFNRKHKLIEGFDPVDFKKRVKDAKKAEGA